MVIFRSLYFLKRKLHKDRVPFFSLSPPFISQHLVHRRHPINVCWNEKGVWCFLTSWFISCDTNLLCAHSLPSSCASPHGPWGHKGTDGSVAVMSITVLQVIPQLSLWLRRLVSSLSTHGTVADQLLSFGLWYKSDLLQILTKMK